MTKFKIDIDDIFRIQSSDEFNELALKIFHYQYHNVKIYHDFVDSLTIQPNSINQYTKIPFLPIQFFKSKKVLTANKSFEKIFKSSGTTQSVRSQHFVHDLELYKSSFINGFKQFYGNPDDWVILALLPSYQEQGGSSLIYMVDHLVQLSKNPLSGYITDSNNLSENLSNLIHNRQKTLLIGVSYALLDWVENGGKLPNNDYLTIMETGGMKGRKKELTRNELHHALKLGFGVPNIHSEYGMTELLSQAYSDKDGIYATPKWMKIIIRDVNDPFSIKKTGKGGVNVIDLANIYSCSFIATQDLGEVYPNDSFSILGRFDYSDTRGCNLLHVE